MNKLDINKKEKRQFNILIILCWASYVTAYAGRLNLNAYIEPMRAQLSVSKTELGLISSLFFFAYGAGQLIHGILSKKYNTRYSVAAALLGSALSNALMAFGGSIELMRVFWLVNGIFQSILWSSLIKTLSTGLPDKMLGRAVVVMSTPPAIGTFLIYGMAAICSSSKVNYKIIFCLPALFLFIAGALWFILTGKIKMHSHADSGEEHSPLKNGKKLFSGFTAAGLCLLAFTAVSNGFIKDGATTWMPSVLKENYGMKESLSIFITVLLPLLAVFGAWLSAFLHKRDKNTSKINTRLFFAETVGLAVLLAVSLRPEQKSPIILIAVFAVSAILMSAVNNVITSIIPLFIKEKANSGLFAGVLDTFCYIGSMLSSFLLGFIADRSGWTGVFFCFLVFAALACALSGISALTDKKNRNAEV